MFEDDIYIQGRIQKANSLKELGINPYGNGIQKEMDCKTFLEKFESLTKLESDDRKDTSIGSSIKDCKVLGTPYIIILGDKTMSVLFIEYPKCSTCKKAKKWLEDHGVDFIDRHIVEENPTAEELKEWHARSGLPLKRFFNTSGQIYRQNNIKDRLPSMSEEEQYALLATNGMLVKRPVIVADDFILVGFKEKEYEERLI